jgi:hypothetical protein
VALKIFWPRTSRVLFITNAMSHNVQFTATTTTTVNNNNNNNNNSNNSNNNNTGSIADDDVTEQLRDRQAFGNGSIAWPLRIDKLQWGMGRRIDMGLYMATQTPQQCNNR